MLGIDYGTTTTRAVLVGPDHRWHPVHIDGVAQIPSGVYAAADGTLIAGEQGWLAGLTDADRYVPHPLARLTAQSVHVGDTQVDPVDLVAATLRTVWQAAIGLGGSPPTQVYLTIPATFGPRRKTLLHTAARRAGLPTPDLVETPRAVAAHLSTAGIPIPVGASILIADYGASRFEATIVHHTATGFICVCTHENTNAGAARIDTALADHVATLTTALTTALPHPPPSSTSAPPTNDPTTDQITSPIPGKAVDADPPVGVRHSAQGGQAGAGPQAQVGQPVDRSLQTLAAFTTAKHTLGHSHAVAVPTPSGVPVVVDQSTLHSLAQPILTGAADTAHAAITAADLTPTGLAGVFCVGGGAGFPTAVAALHEGLGVPTTLAPDPAWAAVLGAVHATGTTPTPPVRVIPAGRPRVRHYTAAALALLAVPVALVQAVKTALPVHLADLYSPVVSVITNWGEYAMIGLLATQAMLTIATMITAYLATDTPDGTRDGSDAISPSRLAMRILPAAALTGLTAAGLVAVIAAFWQGVPAGPFLRWALLPALPVAAAAALAGLLAPRRPAPPTANWLDWYTTPPTSITAAAAGMLLVTFAHTNTDPTLARAVLPATITGAVLFGAATTLALPISRWWRLSAAVPLTLATVALTLLNATGALAVLYGLTLTTWWLTRTLTTTTTATATAATARAVTATRATTPHNTPPAPPTTTPPIPPLTPSTPPANPTDTPVAR